MPARRRNLHSGFVVRLGGILLPIVVFGTLAWGVPSLDLVVAVPVPHFYIVSAASLVAAVLAVVVGLAAVRVRQPRALAVSLGFLSIAGFFSVHGLTTPGPSMIVHEIHHTMQISARLSLFVGSLFFFASTIEPSVRVREALVNRLGRIFALSIVLMCAYVTINVVRPTVFDWAPTGAESHPASGMTTEHSYASPSEVYGGYGAVSVVPTNDPAGAKPALTTSEAAGRDIGYAMAVAAILLFGISAVRYYETYIVAGSPVTLTLAIGLVLLAESQIAMSLGQVWHLSWWIYHGLMLAGFVIPVAAIGAAYHRGSNLNEIVESFFLRDALIRLERPFPEAIAEIIAAIEAKDPYLRGHMRRVARLTVAIASDLQLPEERATAASISALLHDIGKLGIPDAVLHKPTRLTDEEFAVLKEHPERGYDIAMQAPALASVAPIRWHHERLDGSGYPDAIRGDAIPTESRIVAVADVWDALTSDRIYRPAMAPNEAREILMNEAGVKLDADCVHALLRVIERDQSSAEDTVGESRTESLDQSRDTRLAG